MTDENKSAVDEFLGDLKNDANNDPFAKNPDDPFKQTEETPKVEGEEVKEETKEKIDEKPLPFHKDPKVLRFIEKEIAKKTQNIEPVERVERETNNQPDKIDKVLTKIIGNDTPEKLSAIQELKEVLLEREDRGADKAFERIQAERQEEIQAERQADETLMQGFEAIEEDKGVDITSNAPAARKLRGEFINFIEKIAPKDENGEISEFPDIEQTFEVFQSTRQASSQPNRAKELAARSSEQGGGVDNTKPTEQLSWGSEAWERLKESLR